MGDVPFAQKHCVHVDMSVMVPYGTLQVDGHPHLEANEKIRWSVAEVEHRMATN